MALTPTPSTPPDSIPATSLANDSQTPSAWSRACSDQTGTATPSAPDPFAGSTFGPLAPEPGLQILYPLAPSDPGYSDPVSSVTRVPGGVFISLQGYSPETGDQRIVAVVDDDGSIRWRRCLTDMNGWASVVDAERGVIDVEVISTDQGDTQWWAFDLRTGTSQIETDRSADELSATLAALYAVPDVGYDVTVPAAEATLRRVDVDGNVLWSRDDLFDPGDEGFRASTSYANGTEPVTIVRACVGQPIDGVNATGEPCPYALVGITTNDGSTRWQLDGAHAVSLVADGYAIIAAIPNGDAPYQLLDVSTGQVVVDGVSSEPRAFVEECCGGYDYNRVDSEGAIAWTVATDLLNIWYPADLPGPNTTVDLLGPSTTPQVTARFTVMTDQPAGCSPAPCWRLHAVGTGFAAEQVATVTCFIDNGTGWTQQGDSITVKVAADGSLLADPDCHVGQRAGKVKISINGTDSNTLTS